MSIDKEDKEQLSKDIRDWHYELDKDRVVMFEEYKNTLERSKEEDNKEEDDSEFGEDDYDLPLNLKQLAIYNSPVGPVMMPEMTDPTKHFKLWTMYTKVQLTPKLLLKIESIEGIESLEAISRYRARIGIGPLFKDRPVMNNITTLIKDSIRSELKENGV